jgi:hypothetical protein
VPQEKQVLLEQPVQQVLLEQRALPEPQEMDLQERLEQLVVQDLLELPVRQVMLEPQDRQEALVLLVIKVLPDQLET